MKTVNSIMTEKKISDEQLEKELLENQKSLKEIAYEYGYGYPSRPLSERVKELGFEKLNKLNIQKHGALAHISEDVLQQVSDSPDQDLYFSTRTVDGDILLEIDNTQWVKTE